MIIAGNCSPLIANCQFLGNSARFEGGAIYHMQGTSPTILNCTFNQNGATSGGGIYATSSSPKTINSIFTKNTAGTGAGIASNSGSISIVNCLLTENTASASGGGIYNNLSIVNILNSIVWGNTGGELSGQISVTYSCVKSGYLGEGNFDITENPFVNPIDNNYKIPYGSPCIDAGSNIGAPLHDIFGVSRPKGIGVDVGPYEFASLEDTDNDGLPDELEEEHGCDLETYDAQLQVTLDYPSRNASFRELPIHLQGRLLSNYGSSQESVHQIGLGQISQAVV